MGIPVIALIALTVYTTGVKVDSSCPSEVPGIGTGVVAIDDGTVTLVSSQNGTKSWQMVDVAQAYSAGELGVVASSGNKMELLSNSKEEIYEGSHLLLGTGKDTLENWWAFAAVDPSLFGEADDGSTVLAAFPLNNDDTVALCDASGAEFGVIHVASVADVLTITSINDLGEMVSYAIFDGKSLTYLEGFVNEPVEYNRAPFLAAAVQLPLSAVAFLEAPEETEISSTSAWVVRIANQHNGKTFASYQIGSNDGSETFTGLIATPDGALAISDSSAWLVNRTGAKEILASCVTGKITDVDRAYENKESKKKVNDLK
jgi:hypothetical protein